MGVGAIALMLCDSVVVAALFVSSAAKIANPSILVTAVNELHFSNLRPGKNTVRALAIVECAAGFLVSITIAQVWYVAWAVVAVLGMTFFVAGAAGRLRGSTQPCGCFGSDSTHPLGSTNMIIGISFFALALINEGTYHAVNARSLASAPFFVAACACSLWLIFTHRGDARLALRNAFSNVKGGL